ncbi:MAG: DUF3298 and DUF4163 domain-containing protein [Chlorobi bacterium]|nr:DUF3298 and DUF4163 domain-containing protein [Chlorobiota bacterium]
MKSFVMRCIAIPAFMLAVAATACKDSGTNGMKAAEASRPASVPFGYEMKRFEKLYNQGKNPGDSETYCRIAYPVFSGGDAAAVVNRTIEAWIADSTALHPAEGYSGQRTPEALADNFLKDFEVYSKETDMGLPYQFELQGSIVLNNARQLTVQLSSYAYTGGAHGMNTTTFFVFDAATGKRLFIDDVFVPGFKNRLNALIEARFREDKGLSPTDPLDGEKGGLFENRIAFTTNFGLTDKGVSFLYNPYEIAPYAAGSTEIELRFEDLKGLLKPEYFLERA